MLITGKARAGLRVRTGGSDGAETPCVSTRPGLGYAGHGEMVKIGSGRLRASLKRALKC